MLVRKASEMTATSSLIERSVLVDTSAFYAMLDRNDQWHSAAENGFQLLAREKRLLYTTNLVVAETYALAQVRLGYAIALGWQAALDSLNMVFQNSGHHRRVRSLLERYQGQGFSYTDAFSFVTMEEAGIHIAFAFDRHFQEYGWTMFPHTIS